MCLALFNTFQTYTFGFQAISFHSVPFSILFLSLIWNCMMIVEWIMSEYRFENRYKCIHIQAVNRINFPDVRRNQLGVHSGRNSGCFHNPFGFMSQDGAINNGPNAFWPSDNGINEPFNGDLSTI